MRARLKITRKYVKKQRRKRCLNAFRGDANYNADYDGHYNFIAYHTSLKGGEMFVA